MTLSSAAPSQFGKPFANAAAPGDRSVDAVDDQRNAQPDEGGAPSLVDGGQDREQRQGGAAGGEEMDGEEM